MVDQLRQVHPDLENGTDPEVEALKKTVDPHESVEALNQSLERKELSTGYHKSVPPLTGGARADRLRVGGETHAWSQTHSSNCIDR